MEDGGGLGESLWFPRGSPDHAKVQCCVENVGLMRDLTGMRLSRSSLRTAPPHCWCWWARMTISTGRSEVREEISGGNVVLVLTFLLSRNCPRDAGESGESW